LKDWVGNWIQGDREIVEFIKNGYAELFSSSHTYSILSKWNPPCWPNYLNEEEIANLSLPISNEDIKTSLWSLKAFKAPGPDGLHAGFFQRFWLLVGDSLREEVKGIFSLGMILKYLNHTRITLIPKYKNPESFNHYWPMLLEDLDLCCLVWYLLIKLLLLHAEKVSIMPLLCKILSTLCQKKKGGMSIWQLRFGESL